MDIHAVYNELVARSMSFDALRQLSHIPPPGHEYGMYTFDFVAGCWNCRPCSKNIGYGHLTSTKHKNRMWDYVAANITSAAQHTAAAAVLSAGAPTMLALPAPTAGASWAVAAAAAPTVPAPASPAAGAAAQAATTSALRSLENTMDTMQQNHQDALDSLRQEVVQLRHFVDGGLRQATQQLTQLGHQVIQLG